jgi:hypothetical protein
LFTEIDFFGFFTIISVYTKCEPGKAANFLPGSDPHRKDDFQ